MVSLPVRALKREEIFLRTALLLGSSSRFLVQSFLMISLFLEKLCETSPQLFGAACSSATSMAEGEGDATKAERKVSFDV